MESSFIVWHTLPTPPFTVSLWLTVIKKYEKNQPQTNALCANHIIPFVIIQLSSFFPAALHQEELQLSTCNCEDEEEGYPKGDIIYSCD